MRILLLRSHAMRRALPANLRLIPALEALGHRVVPLDLGALSRVFGHDGAQQVAVQAVRAYEPHLALVVPPGDLLAPETSVAIREMGVPLVGWQLDATRVAFESAGGVDAYRRWLVADSARFTVRFTSRRDEWADLRALGVTQAQYLRLAGHLPLVEPESPPSAAEIGFGGDAESVPADDTMAVLGRIVGAGFPVMVRGDVWGDLPEWAPYWQGPSPVVAWPAMDRQTDISLNLAGWRQSVSPRLLDIAFAGGFQVVDCCPELADYFDPGRDIAVVHDFPEVLSAIAYHRAFPAARAQRASAARLRAEREHTWAVRLTELLGMIEGQTDRPVAEDGRPEHVVRAALDGVLNAYRAMLHVSEAAGRMEDAWGYAEALLRVHPGDYSALAARGRWAETAGQAEEAMSCWQQAAGRFSGHAYPWARPEPLLGCLGAGELVPGDPRAELVIRQFRTVFARQDPQAFGSLLRHVARADFAGIEALAADLFRANAFDLACLTFSALREAAPSHGGVALGLARSLICLGRNSEALLVLEDVLAAEPHNREVRLLRSSIMG